MNRPNVTPLPKKHSLQQLKTDRITKNQSLFRMRIVSRPQQFIPSVSSKTLNSRLFQLYPELAQKKYSMKTTREQPTNNFPAFRKSNNFSNSVAQRFRIRESKQHISPQRIPSKGTKILMSTINVKKYDTLF